jgi:sugar/nucleoside kinase (ribokinase family)
MLSAPPPSRLDLLVVGGLTVDRFPDGSAAAGGSALHAALAAAEAGARVGVVTTAGPEPEAEAGLSRLARRAWVVATPARSSIVYEHEEASGVRRLVLVAAGQPIAALPRAATAAVLFAPVAGEVGAALLRRRPAGATAAAILQGWLRSLEPGRAVEPLGPAAIRSEVLDAFHGFDLLVASREDLVAVGTDPARQLDAVRSAVGAAATVVLTDASRGAWVELGGGSRPARRWHEPVPRVVDTARSVGAGDMLAALLLAPPWPRPIDEAWVRQRMAAAMRGVADRLDRRR